MFGNKSQPSLNYSYGASAPFATKGLGLVDQQIRAGHDYKNRLIEVERERRQRVDTLIAQLSPTLQQVETNIAAAEKQIEDLRSAKRAAHAKVGKRTRDPATTKAIKDFSAQKKTLYEQRKSLRDGLFKGPNWKVQSEAIEAWAKKENLRHRSETDAYWGTYLSVEQAMSKMRKGAPPEFRRWTGDGKIAVQIQGGVSLADAVAGKSNFIRIKLKPIVVGEDGRSKRRNVLVPGRKQLKGKTNTDGKVYQKKLGNAVVYLRVGTTKNKPVWAAVPFTYHRDIPSDAAIKWVCLTRRRIGTHFEWRVVFSISRERGWERPDAATSGAVGIDAGWRYMKDDGRLRVAYFMGADGHEGELALPGEWVTEMKKTRDIKSIRDKDLNGMKDGLVAFLKDRELPEWLCRLTGKSSLPTPTSAEATARIAQWRSPARFAGLIRRWRDNRFAGDEVESPQLSDWSKAMYGKLLLAGDKSGRFAARNPSVFDVVAEWQRRDRHLYEYETNLRDQLQKRRSDVYRCFAKSIYTRYKTIVLEDLKLSEFHKLPKAEDPKDKLKNSIRDACISNLMTYIKEVGRDVQVIDPRNTTKTCAECGHKDKWEDKAAQSHTCSHCGVTWDRDRNAAKNILKAAIISAPASGVVVAEPAMTAC